MIFYQITNVPTLLGIVWMLFTLSISSTTSFTSSTTTTFQLVQQQRRQQQPIVSNVIVGKWGIPDQRSISSTPSLSLATKNDDNDSEDDEEENDNNLWNQIENDTFDVETARLELESLLVTSSSASSSYDDDTRSGNGIYSTSSSSSLSLPGVGMSLYYNSFASQPVLNFLNGRSLNDIWDIESVLSGIPVPRRDHPLTSIEELRKQTELHHLQALQYSDDAVTNLFDYWFHERGSNAASKLQAADDLTTKGGLPYQWEAAEKILIDLINEHGVYWVEPIHRLGTLYYIQGNLSAAKVLFQIVLHIKPWHFGAVSTLVKTLADLDESEAATQLASQRLPTLQTSQFASSSAGGIATNTANRRRAKWVQHAIQLASGQFHKRQQSVTELFGALDEHVVSVNQRWDSIYVDINDRWQ